MAMTGKERIAAAGGGHLADGVPPGITTHMMMGMHFMLWAQKQHGPITRQMIEAHFGVHKATAWRWLRYYKDVTT